jgi:putative serine protease PepD
MTLGTDPQNVLQYDSGGEAAPPSALPPPAPAVRTPPHSARWIGAVAVVAVATVCGGIAGWIAADQHTTTTAGATSSASGPINTVGTPLDVGAVLGKVGPSVVNIQSNVVQQTGTSDVSGQAAGTGIVLTSDGKVLTNAHVIAGATSISVTLPGQTASQPATVLTSDTADDVAVIQITGAQNLPPAPLGDSSTVHVGDPVVAIGNALALSGGPTVTSGIVSALGRSIDTDTGSLTGLIQTDAPISSGDSGGPLVNAQGEIVGMDTAGASSSSTVIAENVAFSIPINNVLNVT